MKWSEFKKRGDEQAAGEDPEVVIAATYFDDSLDEASIERKRAVMSADDEMFKADDGDRPVLMIVSR